eukprot:972802-Lingulodinium_polyedra.AAC.1
MVCRAWGSLSSSCSVVCSLFAQASGTAAVLAVFDVNVAFLALRQAVVVLMLAVCFAAIRNALPRGYISTPRD